MAIKKEETSLDSSVNRLQNRVAVPKYYFDKLPKDLRALSFYVSNLEKLREIEMVKRSLKNAIEKGESFEQWRANLNIEGIRNLSRSRLETVYRTNVSSVYNQSARYNSFHSGVTPYLMYTAIMDGRTRPEHAKLNEVVKRADSTFWDKYTPPIAFNCRCGVVPLSKEDADEIGISKRSNQSFPEPEQGFGTKKMGDMLSPVREEAEGAIDALPKNSPYRAKFKEAVEGIDSLVDIWYKKNEDIFNP